MTQDEVVSYGQALVTKMDAEGIPDEIQAAIGGGIFAAAAMALTPSQRKQCIVAHFAALQSVMRGDP